MVNEVFKTTDVPQQALHKHRRSRKVISVARGIIGFQNFQHRRQQAHAGALELHREQPCEIGRGKPLLTDCHGALKAIGDGGICKIHSKASWMFFC